MTKLINIVKTLYLLIIIPFMLHGCSDEAAEYENFMKAYKDILHARVKFSDSVVAQWKVDSILNFYGYTEKEFGKKFFELGNNRPEFVGMLDSLRSNVSRESDSVRQTQKEMLKDTTISLTKDSTGIIRRYKSKQKNDSLFMKMNGKAKDIRSLYD